ncbi:MAG: cytochrome b/b6 domain-containing protein [Archaeoglobaceae archaeon]|nr:cytochrome b/b6 domain-containing protein [Archaeoglobaceae archaeon]MCX8152414.1 cytochrome b/b6 domain-containing protein [Archaeoglobaceae archaeon]MDW8013754.1 cytochrome b/b6 domain-containing protein [Archaeoglobaceae archaeon]
MKISGERIVVERHHKGLRFLHWLIFIEGVVLALTGMQLGGLYKIALTEQVWMIHVVVGFALICSCAALVYYMVATGEYKWFSIRRIPLSIKFFIKESKAWLGIGPAVEEPILYDKEKKEYVEKLVPTVIIVWWVYVVLGLVIIITGLSMVFPDMFSFFYIVGEFFSQIFGGGDYAIIRALHRLSFYLLGTVVIMHSYAAWVFKLLRSIVFGDRAEPVKGKEG